MLNSIISEGKTTAEAIENGLKQLNATKQEVEVKILETEKRSFFSILEPRVVKVELKRKEKRYENKIDEKQLENSTKILRDFLQDFFNSLDKKNIEISIKKKVEHIEITVVGEDASEFIGYRGEILNSLQTILSAVTNKGSNEKVRIQLDICQYRKKRKQALEELAEKLSKTVIHTGKSITLEPMHAYERKIIHSKLQNRNDIKTYSIGEEPYRKVVITKK